MGGTIITAFRWSILNISSAALVVLWAFNPLGSQASFRGVHLKSGTDAFLGQIRTYDPRLSTQSLLRDYAIDPDRMSPTLHAIDPDRMSPTVRALYSTVLYDSISGTQFVDPANTSSKGIVANLGGDSSAGIQAATDNWGNVRIPTLIYSNDYDPANPDKWLNMPWDKKVLNYSSLLGDRVDGVNRTFTGNTTFTITSSFQQFNVSHSRRRDLRFVSNIKSHG
jgi:hypothetical protein